LLFFASHPQNSIAFKVFGAIVALLLLMAAAAAISLWEARSVGQRLGRAIGSYIPTYASLARANVRSLEQALLIRRIVIAHLAAPGTITSADDLQAVAQKTKGVEDEIGTARRLLEGEIANAQEFGDTLGLVRLDTRLEAVQAELARLSEEQDSLLNAIGAREDVETKLSALERVRDGVNARLDSVRADMRKLLEEAARRTDSEQHRVVLVSLFVAGFAAVIGLGLAGVMTLGLIRPVRRLLAATRSVEAGSLDVQVPITSSDEIGSLTGAFNRMVDELRDKARIRDTFGKYLDPRIVEGLVDRPELLSSRGERRVMTIYFSDIQGFTAISEGLTPAALVNMLNHYLTAMSDAIRRNGGIIDKYIGDGIMAFWGPPFTPASEQAKVACAAGLEQLALVPSIRAALPEVLGIKRHLPELDIRIGIATGDVVVGNIGSPASMSYTVMGDTVNLASRLEGASRIYGTKFLVSAATMAMAEDEFEFREVDSVFVAGKQEPERIFEPLGRRGEIPEAKLNLATQYAVGLSAYRKRSWNEAATAFRQCLEIWPGDGPTEALLQRIPALANQALSENWNGVWRIEK
jgi:class 3 adenylate cyclase